MYCNGTDWIAFGALNPSAGGSGCTNPDRAEGAVVYNNSFHVLQYCDGDDWKAVGGTVVGGGGCAAPASCPNVGDVCADGSLFAGFMLYNKSFCEPLYVTDDNQSTASQWKNATGTDDISPDDHVNGKVNAAGRTGSISDFQAFDLCESNTYHGKSDWYLPARTELNLLWLNRAEINAGAAGNFTENSYWSSTEYNTSNARNQSFEDGRQYRNLKTNSYDIRCVRRDGGPTGCPHIGDLCSDGSIFAGDTNMYVTDVNQSTGIQWASTGGNDDINPDSPTDGAANHANVTGSISALPALNLCETLDRHGQTDWYLPARDELDHLYTNRIAIGGFTTSPYWSSTEGSSTGAWRQFFDGGAQLSHTKTNSLDVRCIRRE